jgi:hypothetical protein
MDPTWRLVLDKFGHGWPEERRADHEEIKLK